MKEIYVYKSKYQIWRLLISGKNRLLIEERDVENKEVYFSCIDVKNSSEIFSLKQFDEKYWIGIESIFDEKIYLHKFGKPDMPAHKGIVAFDIETQKIIWENEDYNFLFVNEEGIYTYVQKFETRKYFLLNHLTGEVLEELNLDPVQINNMKNETLSPEKFKDYIFPEPYSEEELNDEENQVISEIIKGDEITGTVELAKYNDLLLFNYYYKNKSGLLNNKFFAVNSVEKKIVHENILLENANAFVPDSFFIKENYLFVLKGKNSVLIYEL